MDYHPTALDVIGVYMAAAMAHYHIPSDVIEQPSLSQVKQTALGVFRILPTPAHNAEGERFEDIAICMYDEEQALWYVRLQDGAIGRVRKENDHFAVVSG